MAQNGRFMARWANFFAEMPLEGLCWASFFAELLRNGALGEFFAELQALMVGVWCARSGCGRPSAAGDQFRMQFPHDSFKP